MPRIRKKSSKRVSTNERRKVANKVRESRKKKKKAAKKNPQWRSKKPEDPGIPNNFPFKDQVLAEVSQQRRFDAAEQQRKKVEQKALHAQSTRGVSDTSVWDDKEEEEDQLPVLLRHGLPTLRAVLEESDIVIEVLDARDPLPFRSLHLEGLIASRPERRTLLILNKIDTCPRESIMAWAAYLRTEHPTLLFRSATAFLPLGPDVTIQSNKKGKAKVSADDGLGVDSVVAYLSEAARAKNDDKPLVVAVLGLTNAGKSSFINSILRKPVFPVYSLDMSKGPSTTEVAQETMMELGGRQVRWIDTPGLVWEADDTVTSAEVRARDILLRSKGRIDRLKDTSMAISYIISQSTTEDLMLLYGLPAFVKGDTNSFLSGVARSHQLVKKRGELDLIGASRIVLRDWSTGKFPRCTNPLLKKSTPSVTVDCTDGIKKLYAAELSVLAAFPTQKEKWKSSGLVRLVPGDLEVRKVDLDQQWRSWDEAQEEGGDVESVEEGSIDNERGHHKSPDGDDEEAEDDSNHDETPRMAPSVLKQAKRKRQIESTAFHPMKKLAFAFAAEGSSSRHLLNQTMSTTPAIQTRNGPVVKKSKVPHFSTRRS